MNSSGQPRTSPDSRLARWAARRHNVVTTDDLRGLGIDLAAIEYRLRVGRLHAQHRGVYSVGIPTLTMEGRFLAAVLALGDGAVLSHRCAAALWELRALRRSERGEVDVMVARSVARRRGIRPRCVRVLEREDVTERDGIPVTAVARTLVDLACDVSQREARRALNEALVQRRVTVPLMYRQLGRAGRRRGAAVLRRVIADAAPTRSELEDVVLEFLRRHGMPNPVTNAIVGGWEVDFLYPDLGLVIEADGGRFHDSPLAKADDARKQAAIEALGHCVLRLRWEDVTRDEHRTAARLASICAAPTSRAA